MRFINGEDMLTHIIAGHDLYNKEKEIYVFVYNSADSICYYFISNEEAEELKKKAEDSDELWSTFLGVGGWIVDSPEYECYTEGSETPLEWCEDNYEGNWEVV